MADRHILSVDPASGRGEPVVVEVLQNGSQPLDLRLVGCEGENPYVATIKHRNLAKLKHKFKGSDEDWATVLSHFLLQQPATNSAVLTGVRLVYTLKDALELSFRQDVQGIKVTLGEILLPRDDDFEFNPFDWAQVSARAHAETLQQLTRLKSQASGELDMIAKLNAQLDDFIKTKTDTESAMLQQFMGLLNEKKRKIRDQGRLLAEAQVDKSVATAVQSTRREAKPRRPAGSRQSKRKAPAQAAEPDDAPDLDSDQMEIEQAKDEEQDNDEATPDPSDDETDEEEAKSETIGSSSIAQAVSEKEKEEVKSDGNPPPKRELPFGRPATRSKQPTRQPSPPVDEEDDTEDEEL